VAARLYSPAVQPRTHLAIDRRLCGEPLDSAATVAGTARVGLTTVPEMAADAAGLVHGGFVFGLADHAAMLAVNHPNVVLGSAAVRFLRPVAVGERLIAEATVAESAGRRSRVLVEVRRAAAAGAGGADASGGVDASGGADGVGEAAGETVMSGELVCFSLDRHVLEPAGKAGDGDADGDGDGRQAEPQPAAGA
jgi:acyl-coenzyme A thioesterase PaaI-like protein